MANTLNLEDNLEQCKSWFADITRDRCGVLRPEQTHSLRNELGDMWSFGVDAFTRESQLRVMESDPERLIGSIGVPIIATYKGQRWEAARLYLIFFLTIDGDVHISHGDLIDHRNGRGDWSYIGSFGTKPLQPLQKTRDEYGDWIAGNLASVLNVVKATMGRILMEKWQEFLRADETSEIEELRKQLAEAEAKAKQAVEESSLDKLMKQAMIANLEPVMQAKAREMADEFQARGAIPTVMEVHVADKVNTIEGLVHEKFTQVLTMVENDIPVYLMGPAGTGKNVLAEQIAEATGREFEYMGKVDDKFTDCVGYGDANGREHETPLTRAVRNGKLLFVDEIDASIPEVLVTINALLANRYMVTGWGEFLRADKNFRVIVAGNTSGRGADSSYSGRYSLDAATLDRFVMVNIDYDKAIEEHLSNGNKEALEYVRAFRDGLEAVGDVPHPVTYRTIINMTRLDETGLSKKDILTSCLFKELDKDDIRVINTWIREHFSHMIDNNCYQKAAYEMLSQY